ncbi:LysR family transcriptional regulator [Candidatus Francisella endociliophora]|uniref:LysR family transcriptional regulator n=1 Tax=Candidatus Francisella endociliophora TaxID=653937 RepID=A0A097EPG1_9GAMM|nr:LysR family transcriptional regulator [Francisella sp. FSC1006]AIT09459.1 LysR family transcriptional regulator [Francisella sp. FSC1006]
MSVGKTKEVIDKNILEGTRYFISLVELGSYTAVKNFYAVEISTVRSKLEILESYLGIKLIQTNSNKIEITKDGRKYYASCHRLYTDLENSILSSKYNGIDNLKYIRVFGTRFFINYLAQCIHKIDEAGKYTFTFDSYLLYHSSSYFYQLSNYDIAIVTSGDLEKIDQDRWMVCATIDSVNLPSKIYLSEKLIEQYDLKDKPTNIFKVPFIFRRDNLAHNLTINVDGKEISSPIKHLRYIVEDDNQKVALIEKGLGAGILLDNYNQIIDSSITALEGVTTETFHDKQTVIISKYIDNRTKIIEFLREQAAQYVKTILGQ